MIKYYCDRCEKEVPSIKSLKAVATLSSTRDSYAEPPKQLGVLCEDCVRNLENDFFKPLPKQAKLE